MPRRILEGRVVSDKQDKTVTVLVERRTMHPIYKKYIKKSSKFAAHDETNSVKEGQMVQIIECAPISKNKHFTVYTGTEDQKPEVKKETSAKKPAAKKAAPKKTAGADSATTKKAKDDK